MSMYTFSISANSGAGFSASRLGANITCQEVRFRGQYNCWECFGHYVFQEWQHQ